MTDLIPQFIELLSKYNVGIKTSKPLKLPRIDNFIDEAHNINAKILEIKIFLKKIRQPYLARDAHPRHAYNTVNKRQSKFLTNREKEEIDAKLKQIFRELDAAIRILAEAEDVRRQTEFSLVKKKYGQWNLGAIGAWAAGSIGQIKSYEQEIEEARINTISTHRENVLYFLRESLQQRASHQAYMMEKRIKRDMENNRSLLQHSRIDKKTDPGANFRAISLTKNGLDQFEASRDTENNRLDELSSEQIQTFEKENQDMIRYYESTLNQVRTAEKSLVEISELQTQLVHNLAAQSAHIEQLVADSYLTTENIGDGNKQLKEATQRKSTAKYVFYASCALSFSLVFWDMLI